MSCCKIGGEELNTLFYTEDSWRMHGTKDSKDGHAFLRMAQDEWVAQSRGDIHRYLSRWTLRLKMLWHNRDGIFEVINLKQPFPGGSVVKNLPAKQETWIQSLGWEDLLEEEMATHSSILILEILWTEEPGGLQFMGSQKSQT